jgi:polyisoprenoid-binding protein YceI
MGVSRFCSRFGEFDARLCVDEDGPARLTGSVRSASLDIRDPELAAHLAAPTFFDAQRYPELRFESTTLRRRDVHVEVEGLLTIKDRTLPIAATGSIADPREDPSGHMHMGLELVAHIDRRQFGLDWNMVLPKGGMALGNDVALQVSLALRMA